MNTTTIKVNAKRRLRAMALATIVTAVAVLLSSCAGVTPSDYAKATPKLVLEEYFDGDVSAWGMFQDRGGKVIRRFTVAISGSWKDNKGKLVEDFVYDDGEKDQRIWYITRNGDGSYTGKADDVIGTATGTAAGNALNWTYTLALPVDGTTYHVQLNDWMYLVNDDVLINRAVMSKFGFRVGEVLITFKRKEQAS